MYSQEGELFINDDCTLKCHCTNSQLNCNKTFSCGENAECGVVSNVRQCSCIHGYEGDGQLCAALFKDCKDAYDAGHTKDGIYTILPSGWPRKPFSVYCKMDNGGGWTVSHSDFTTFLCFENIPDFLLDTCR